jgi:50S ribosomal subunit-associated GTPase HflX
LGAYAEALLEKKFLVTVNKLDIYTDQQIDAIRSLFEQKNTNVMFFSTVTGTGMAELRTEIERLLVVEQDELEAAE